nr:retrovirus-related Pol polyprotein from transposon TNT 1-94 [Tanacetum cinerariifolium]
YSIVSKAMRVFNKRTRIVEETLNIRFIENAPNVKGNGLDYLFYIDSLTISMNYEPVVAGKQTNGIAGTKYNIVAGQAKKKKELEQEYILIPICTTDPLNSQGPNDSAVDAAKKATEVYERQVSDNVGQDDQVTRNKWAIGTKWVFKNKKDERGIVVKNKSRLVAQGYTQEEDFVVYQMDVKGAFLYGKIEEEAYVCQPPSFEDPNFPDKFYKVKKALYGLHQAPRSWYEILSTYLMNNGLQVQQKSDEIFINQEKYVADILKKFDFTTVKTTSTPMKPNKALVKDTKAEDVDVHLYRSMVGSLMYLTASRHNITFAVYACVRFQVTPKTLHLHVVKRIFRYLKGHPKLGLWYPRDSPFDLEA